MSKFSFLKTINEKFVDGDPVPEKKKLTEGIKYEEYELEMLDGKMKTVYIPVRRTSIFEEEVTNSEILSESTVREILRKCNGVTKI